MTFVPARVMAVTPHGDDITLFAGGTLARWIRAGAEVMVVRVTQDEKDSIENSVDETVALNHREFEEAMSVLGVQKTVDLAFRDCELRDVPYGKLRGHLIRRIRDFRPELILSFDPAVTDDDNPDHRVTATAAADSAWAAAYPNFHPEHADANLETHVVRGCYYFTTQFVLGETIVDIGEVLEQKARAVICHRTMMRALLASHQDRVAAAGIHIPALEELRLDDYASYWERLVRAAAALAAQGTEFAAAERFRSTVLTEQNPLVQYLLTL